MFGDWVRWGQNDSIHHLSGNLVLRKFKRVIEIETEIEIEIEMTQLKIKLFN